ncbi:hypothetical protein MBEHAL_1263 [Halarchaeum acidiphilum MH1-52-1]|uniref:Uncharacterized protein n=1 Tax=Halarchaeum acidiphilum MH1-52-1 TaxID=1261545 RepID=U3ACK1_9EURY|nr:hypothetical protein [Halarchaeum acidiphilum]GAD52503.1 hypothetical protein MBEHAL_1263 [Halarchaeum acidiphilum MH1-52-1]
MDFEMVAVSGPLDVPSCTPAQFDYASNPAVTDAEAILRDFDASPFAVWDSTTSNGSKWYEFSVTARVTDQESGEEGTASISTAGITITTKDDDSFETFERVVHAIGRAVHWQLETAEAGAGE